MTAETQTKLKNHDTLRIPSREEFHRHYGGNIHELEFCTCHPIIWNRRWFCHCR